MTSPIAPSQRLSITATRLRTVALSTIINAVVGCFWGLNGTIAFLGTTRLVLMGIVVIITALLGWAGLGFRRAARLAPADTSAKTNPFRTRAYLFAVIAQCIAIPIVSWMLTASGYSNAIISAIAVIVGLHFFGLVSAFQSSRYAGIAIAMVAVGALSLLLPASLSVAGTAYAIDLRAAVVGWGCALILWISILPLIQETRRLMRQLPS